MYSRAHRSADQSIYGVDVCARERFTETAAVVSTSVTSDRRIALLRLAIRRQHEVTRPQAAAIIDKAKTTKPSPQQRLVENAASLRKRSSWQRHARGWVSLRGTMMSARTRMRARRLSGARPRFTSIASRLRPSARSGMSKTQSTNRLVLNGLHRQHDGSLQLDLRYSVSQEIGFTAKGKMHRGRLRCSVSCWCGGMRWNPGSKQRHRRQEIRRCVQRRSNRQAS